MKSFNASKVKAGENGAAEAIQTKQSVQENGAASMSQVAAQSAIKKPAEDSLSPFSSDAEDDKPKAAAATNAAAGTE